MCPTNPNQDAQPALIVVQDEAGAARAEEAMAVAGGSAVVRLVEEVVDAGGRGKLVSGAEEDGEEGERHGGPRLEGVSHIFFTSGSTGRPKVGSYPCCKLTAPVNSVPRSRME